MEIRLYLYSILISIFMIFGVNYVVADINIASAIALLVVPIVIGVLVGSLKEEMLGDRNFLIQISIVLALVKLAVCFVFMDYMTLELGAVLPLFQGLFAYILIPFGGKLVTVKS